MNVMWRYTQVLERSLTKTCQPLLIETRTIKTFQKPQDHQSGDHVSQAQALPSNGSDVINNRTFVETLAEVTLKWFKEIPIILKYQHFQPLAGKSTERANEETSHFPQTQNLAMCAIYTSLNTKPLVILDETLKNEMIKRSAPYARLQGSPTSLRQPRCYIRHHQRL